MAKQFDISPNVPDVEPDYVDLDNFPGTGAKTTPAEPDRDAPGRPPASAGEDAAPPPPSSLEPALMLNATLLPAGDTQPPARNDEAVPPRSPTLREVEETVLDATGIATEPPIPPPAVETGKPIPPVPPVPPPAPEAVASQPAGDADAARHRDGECIPNVPDAAPLLVAEADVARPASGEDDGAPVIPPEKRGSWLRWDVVVTILIVSLFGLLVFSQAISALALAATLPVWAQYLLLIPLGFCCLAVLLVCASVVVAWFRLRAVRQIDLRAMEELRRRAQTRQDATRHFQEARADLERYLRGYPLEADGVRRLRDAGVAEEVCATLAKDRDYLLGRTTDSLSWIGEFRDHFQSTLDRAARGRIRHWAITAAGCVVASPVPLLDAALVLGVTMKMIKDLCFIYNVRGGRSASLVLLNRAIVTAFIAGVAEDAATAATDAAGDELAGLFGESAVGALGAGVARAVAPKLGEGAINAFFVNRLGRATMRLLQPLKPR